MNFKTVILTYKGHGLFRANRKFALRKGQRVRVSLGPTPIRTATRGVSHMPQRMVEWPTHDGTVGAWTTVRG